MQEYIEMTAYLMHRAIIYIFSLWIVYTHLVAFLQNLKKKKKKKKQTSDTKDVLADRLVLSIIVHLIFL